MPGFFAECVEKLQKLAQKHGVVLVSYSGGKDSRVVLDLAVKNFQSVIAFHFAYLPGSRYTQEIIRDVQQRYGITPRVYIASSFIIDKQRAQYCDPTSEYDHIDPMRVIDYQLAILAESNAKLILDGQRKSDGPRRKNVLKRQKMNSPLISPIQDWTQYEVYAYLELHKIPKPPDMEKKTGGIGLSRESIRFLHQHYHDDYEQLRKHFPYVEAAIAHDRFFGAEQDRDDTPYSGPQHTWRY